MSSPAHMLVPLAIVTIVSCSFAGEDREATLAAIAAHADRFEAFDAWARRTVIAEPSPPGSSAFSETLFAPLRGDDAVIDAWVVREGTSPRTWRMHERVSDIEIADVRAPRLGHVRAGLGTRTDHDVVRRVVVIERQKDETASTHVVVAAVFVVE